MQANNVSARVICVVSAAACALAGCASSYTPPAEAVALRSRLGPERARHIVLDSFKEKPPHFGGLFSAGPSQVKPWDVKLEGTQLTYMNLNYPTVAGVSMNYYGQVSTRTEMKPGKYELDLSRVSKIRIVENDGKSVPNAPVPGYVVWFYETNLKYGCVNVSPEKLDEVLAALTYFSPDARLMKGMGL